MIQSKEISNSLPILPHSIIIEEGILNILLNNSSIIKKTISKLKIESFYFEPHRIIYKTIVQLSEKNTRITLPILISYFQEHDLLEKIGGIPYLVGIINKFEDFLALDDYIKILNDNYLRRLLIESGKQIIDLGYLTSMPVNEILEKIDNSIVELNQEKIAENIYSMKEMVNSFFLEMKENIKKDKNSNFKTSFIDLDSIIEGFEPEDLIIIAGRPSMGKTAFALNIGKNIVEKHHIPLILFTLEMSRQQILYRFLASDAQINLSRLKSAKMTSEEWKKFSLSMKTISELPIFIDDNPNINLFEIRSKIRKIFHEKKKGGLVIIDYLQLMKANFKIENRVQEISHITRSLKTMAKEFEIPIIVLSQLSRSLESRVNKRPMLSDLRESGCLSCVENKKKIYSWNNESTRRFVFDENTLKYEFKGLKPTYQICFENNIDIFLTSNHRILSKKGWIKISQITSTSEFYFLIYKKKETPVSGYYKVKSMSYYGLNNVYEKTIPFYHNYFYKNFLMHNSIEQDSDIVIMLYREGYYENKKNNKQITELIVAKHRNGPIGTARLIFNPYFTTFKNI